MRRSFALALVLSAMGCPADGPLESPPDASTEVDMGNPDTAEASVQLSDVSPAEGPLAGGTMVSLTGEGFAEGMTVRFGSGRAVEATVESPILALVSTPPSGVAGAVIVVVQNPDGGTDSLQGAFTYVGDVQPMGGVTFCQLQAQSPAAGTSGVASDALYAIAFADGITTGSGQGTGIEAELGWGADDAYESFNFVPMSYNLDVDGIATGDLANDEYGSPLTISAAGTYRYAARFRVAGATDWTYCDLDGNENGISADQLGVITISDPPTPTVGFCRTDTQSARAQTGMASEAIQATVFVAGATLGVGAGSGVVGELLYGTGSDPTAWMSVSASFAADADGLTPGDLANDVWTVSPVVAAEGDYNYLFRFSADNGTSWQLCDTDGASGAADLDTTLSGTLEVRDVLVELADRCNLQFPQVVENAEVGSPIDIFGRVEEPGLTGSGTANASLVAEAFVGPVGADPRADFAPFQAVTAQISSNTVNLGAGEDEYVAAFTPQTAGEFAFGYRFSVDGGTTWAYCGLQDDVTPTGVFTPSRLGLLTAASGADTVDFCHVWQDTLTDDAAAANLPTITVEVFEDPLTVGNNGSNSAQLEVESAAIPLELNPAFAPVSWTAVPYKALRVGYPNNYEYEGSAYAAAAQPAAGKYVVVARVRKTGQATWTYCDTDENAPDFRLDAATPLTVTP